MKNRRSILLISGSGRSGTTILSLLLSQGRSILNVGQLRDIWAGWAKPVICACGEELGSCSLWGTLVDIVCPDRDIDKIKSSQKAMRNFLKDAGKQKNWMNEKILSELAERHAGFLDELQRLLNALFEKSDARVIVDSSKSPEFALAVHMTDIADVYVLNVARDPRAVAYSWRCKGTANVPRQMDAWLERQKRLSSWSETAHLKHRRLRYEDFARNPEPYLSDILNWVGEVLPPDIFTGKNSVCLSWDGQHIYPPANEKVLAEKLEVQQIKAPIEWRSVKHWRLHFSALSDTFPTGPLYILGTMFRTKY